MHSLTVENVSLVFPLYTKGPQSEYADRPEDDARILRSPSGRILGVEALRDISLSIKGGERVALIGRNGSGKTTLLQVLAGIITPDRGRVIVEGQSTNLININIGMRQEATGHRNITLRGLAAGRSLAEIEERRRQIADFAELGDFLNLPVETYSSGMRMRLSFAIATAFDPEILLLDEWISTGDASFRKKATQRMRGFVDKAGILVLASHSKSLIAANCERAVWLERGRVRADGPQAEIFEAYRAETAGGARAAIIKARRRAARKQAAKQAALP